MEIQETENAGCNTLQRVVFVIISIVTGEKNPSIIIKQETPVSTVNMKRLRIKRVNEQSLSLTRNTVNIFRNLRRAVTCRSVFIFSFHCS